MLTVGQRSPQLQQVLAQNERLEEKWNAPAGSIDSLRSRFLSIQDEVQGLVDSAVAASHATKDHDTDDYDVAIGLIERWSAIAAYANGHIFVASIPRDMRRVKNLVDRTTKSSRIVGVVVSTKMQKTVTVLVERKIKHPRYGKFIRRSTRYLVHDEYGDCKEGDLIVAVEGRPLSKRKRHSLLTKLISSGSQPTSGRPTGSKLLDIWKDLQADSSEE
jgi:small subunit ribosomal protein S17